jgi:hypothetical protein
VLGAKGSSVSDTFLAVFSFASPMICNQQERQQKKEKKKEKERERKRERESGWGK